MSARPTDNTGEEPAEGGGHVTFVCGALRSGTTLLRLMLNHHPRLTNPGEMDFLFECPLDEDGQPDVEAYRNYLRVNRIFLATSLLIDDALDYRGLARSFVDGVRSPGRLLTINIHHHFDRISEIFPDARYVHLLRDPRDVARSSVGMGWAGNVYRGIDHWIGSERSFEKLKSQVNADQVYEFKNEDLIADVERTLTALCGFFGVPYDTKMLSYAEHSSYSAPDMSLVNQWKRLQTQYEVGLVEGRVGAMLEARGYAPSGYPVVIPKGLERAKLDAQNRFGRLRTQVRRYGLLLIGLEIISRRLRIAGLKDAVQRRMNAKAVQFLK